VGCAFFFLRRPWLAWLTRLTKGTVALRATPAVIFRVFIFFQTLALSSGAIRVQTTIPDARTARRGTAGPGRGLPGGKDLTGRTSLLPSVGPSPWA
jgi:hypothetical protein